MRFLPLLLLGCPRGPEPIQYDAWVYGDAFLYNGSGSAPIDVRIDPLATRIDCALLRYPEAAAALPLDPAWTPLSFEFNAHELLAPWQDHIESRADWLPCYAARVVADDRTATLVFDLGLGPQDVGVPLQPSDLSYNTLLIEPRSDGPVFRAGPQENQLVVDELYASCDLVLPSWHATPTTSATLLDVDHDGACQVLTLLDDQQVRICDAPDVPYLVGEDLDVEVGPDHLALRTSTGTKPYLLGTAPGALPGWLDVQVYRDVQDQTDRVRDPVCDVPSPCGPTLPVDPIFGTTGPYDFAPWGEPRAVVDPDGSGRILTVYAAGAPVLRTCPMALAFSLVPNTPL